MPRTYVGCDKEPKKKNRIVFLGSRGRVGRIEQGKRTGSITRKEYNTRAVVEAVSTRWNINFKASFAA